MGSAELKSSEGDLSDHAKAIFSLCKILTLGLRKVLKKFIWLDLEINLYDLFKKKRR